MMTKFQPDTSYMKLAYIDRRDFVNQISNVERVADEELEEEFDNWFKSVQAEAWIEGYHRALTGSAPPENPYEEETS